MKRLISYLQDRNPAMLQRVKRGVIWTVVALPFAALLWGAILVARHADEIESIAHSVLPDSSIVYDRNQRKIGEFFSRYHVYVPLNEIPKDLIDALLAIEDRDFFKHRGVDWRSLGRAGLAVLRSGKYAQGGSTISMQVVRNYLLNREKTLSRKLKEIILSYQMERTLTKERILELYLNTMYMGNGAYGVGAASLVYFGKTVKKLNTAELAVLAGLFQSPSLVNPKRNQAETLKRQRLVLKAMKDVGVLSDAAFNKVSKTKLKFKITDPVDTDFAPYYLAWIRELVPELLGDEDLALNDHGLRIYTTLDYNMQAVANRAIEASVPKLAAIEKRLKLSDKDKVESALLSVDRSTGGVLAMVGGTDFVRSEFNRTIASVRSPGSAFKAVVYATALNQGMSLDEQVDTAAKTIDDYSWNEHADPVPPMISLRRAFALSLNNPAVNLAATYGVQSIIDMAIKMGIQSPIPREYGIALGGFGVRMTDMARAYATIANQGVPNPTWTIAKITDRSGKVLYAVPPSTGEAPAFDAAVSRQLAEAMYAVLDEGTGSSHAYLTKVAVGKTGTSNDGRDNWFCGFSKNIATVVWVGSDLHASLGQSASGAGLALPIWAQAVSRYNDAPPIEGDIVQSIGSKLLDWFSLKTGRL